MLLLQIAKVMSLMKSNVKSQMCWNSDEIFNDTFKMDIGEQSHSYYPTSIITPTFVPLKSLFNCSIIYTLISSMPVFHLIIIMCLSRYLMNCRIFIFFDSMYVLFFHIIPDKAVIVIRLKEKKYWYIFIFVHLTDQNRDFVPWLKSFA